MLLDYGDVIVHIFSSEEREYYKLDEMWSAARFVVHMA
jgi:ribosome-associated protein